MYYWIHEGRAFCSAGAPIRCVRTSKPHLAVADGRWWSSGNGHFRDRREAQKFADLVNKVEGRPTVEIG